MLARVKKMNWNCRGRRECTRHFPNPPLGLCICRLKPAPGEAIRLSQLQLCHGAPGRFAARAARLPDSRLRTPPFARWLAQRRDSPEKASCQETVPSVAKDERLAANDLPDRRSWWLH